MWGFQNLRESVQNQASAMLRNLSEILAGENEPQNATRAGHRDAMQNVVTPQTIPQFVLPPTLNHDFGEELSNEQGYQNEYIKSRTTQEIIENGLLKTDSGSSYGGLENLQISHRNRSDHSDETDGAKEQSSPRHKKSSGLNPSLSIKNLMQRKKSDSKAPPPTIGRERSLKVTDSSCGKAKSDQVRVGDLEQPGMSLQHLVAAKSGFPLLSESPNTRRKESLFFAPEEPWSESQRKYDASRSPVSGNNSPSRLSPHVSPASSLRRRPFSKSERRRTYINSLRVDGEQRRRSFNEETVHFPASENEEKSPTNLTKRRMSISEQNLSKNLDVVQTPSVRLCVTYLNELKKLNVSILEGKHFMQRHSIYFKVTLLPRRDRERTDPIKIECANPDIKERLAFDSVDEAAIPHMSLKISCKEKSGRIRQSVVIGECMLALCDINISKANDIWINLNQSKIEEAPHIQLTLSYDAMLGCVFVDVVAVRNVSKGSLGRRPDCFVTLTEILPNARTTRKQTKIFHRTLDPVFLESFFFSLCTDAQTPDELVIIATLFVKDRVRGTTEAVGEASLGQLVDNRSGRWQWAQALANEGEAITLWHPLVPPKPR